MAHENINERRIFVLENILLLKNDSKLRRKAAKIYGCTPTAIYADIAFLSRTNNDCIFPSQKTRNKILERDNYICQYCLKSPKILVVDHVISFYNGGTGKEYNLVCSCQPCNLRKNKNNTIPHNFHVLEKLNPEWAKKIMDLHIDKKTAKIKAQNFLMGK